MGPGTMLQRMHKNHPVLHTECPWEVFTPGMQTSVKSHLVSLSEFSTTEPSTFQDTKRGEKKKLVGPSRLVIRSVDIVMRRVTLTSLMLFSDQCILTTERSTTY